MTPDRLEEIKSRLADATPGPWGWSGCANDRVDVCSKAPGWEGAEIAGVTKDYEFNNRDGLVDGMPVMDRAMAHANGALIMHAPTDLRELVAEVGRLRAAIGNALTNGHMNALCWAQNDDECVGRCRVLRDALKEGE